MVRRWETEVNPSYGVAGEAADGRIRVELDADGRLWDLALDPRVMTLPVEELRSALITAITRAQDDLLDEVEEAARPYAIAYPQQVSDASAVAERRFAEISTALYDIAKRADRSW